MSDVTTERTPFLIAAEINAIKYQTGKILLAGAVEIGRRLTEAKALIEYGEWSKWLEESVSYSQSTAQRLMRIYDAYGSQQPESLSASAHAQVLPSLNYSQALVLLGVPEEERVQFINDLEIDSMSIRELQKAVDERKQAQQEKDLAEQEKANLCKALDDVKEKNTKLAKEHNDLKTKVDALQKSKKELEQDVQTKMLENKKLKETMEYKNYLRVKNELTTTQMKLLTSKIAFQLESLTKGYAEMSYQMNLLLKLDKVLHDEYSKKLNSFLIKTLEGRIGAVTIPPGKDPNTQNEI
jgi:predicted RNase H-like nuclease (RuvC/YqgF family)